MKLLKSKTTKRIILLFRADKMNGIGLDITGGFSNEWNLNNFKEVFSENSKKRKK